MAGGCPSAAWTPPARCRTPTTPCRLGPIYQDENGTDHIFYPTLHDGDADDAAVAGVSDVEYTRDGSYLRLKVYTAGYREIECPDGSVRRFERTGMPTQLRDAFSNSLTINYGTANQWVITDSQGRTQRVWFRTDLPGYAQTGRSHRPGHLRRRPATYQFTYSTQAIGRPCPHNDTDQMGSIGPTVNVPLLTGVTLPDGSAWRTRRATTWSTLPSGSTWPDNACTENAGNLTALDPADARADGVDLAEGLFPDRSSTTKPHLQTNPGVASRGMRDRGGVLLGVWSYAFGPAIRRP